MIIMVGSAKRNYASDVLMVVNCSKSMQIPGIQDDCHRDSKHFG